MSRPILIDEVSSIFSIIELDFGTPFTEQGPPPEHLEDIFKRCLNLLDQEEKPNWMQWGADNAARNQVSIQLGRRTSGGRRYFDPQMTISTTKAVPRAIEQLSPFLIGPPRIRHIQSPDSNDECILCGSYPFYERHCDVVIIEAPSTCGPLYEQISAEMTTLRCNYLSRHPVRPSRRIPCREDIEELILGFDEHGKTTNSGLGCDIRTFVLLVYWSDTEAMARVKEPDPEFMSKCRPVINNDWWESEIVERLARLESRGARVKQGTVEYRLFMANCPLLWPDAEILAASQAAEGVQWQTMPKNKRSGCKSCCTM